ncbi:glycine zipper 2TM domain-containing protein [Cupriavidus sp. RAF12]|uniref:glycine zipper 2TM domain-containing protein n=1 Tax=Cupriavidus sp. RAF12 TaxID=3233050 RepID=UPI003F93615A
MQSPATVSSASKESVPTPSLPPQRRLHPLVGAAAVAVVIASLTAVAAVTGVLPLGKANQGPAYDPAPYAAQAPQPLTSSGSSTSSPANQPNQANQVNEALPPGSTTRPPAYDMQQAQLAQNAQSAQNAAPQPPAQQAQPEQRPTPASKPSHTAGRVTNVTTIESEKPTSGVGAVGGAVVGGLLGNQIGHGNGRILGTVAGAAAGGFAGNYVEKRVNKDKQYRVSVQMDDGSRRTFTYQNPPGVEVGQRVHMEKGVLVTG